MEPTRIRSSGIESSITLGNLTVAGNSVLGNTFIGNLFYSNGATFVGGGGGGNGYAGSVGFTGSAGISGFTGSVGFVGSQGIIYSNTAPPDTTTVWFDTSSNISAAGYTGSVGATGLQGYTGSAGIGYTGSAATAVSVTPAAVSDQVNTSTGYFAVPAGNTAQRPLNPNVGIVRYNTSLGGFEFYSSLGWVTLGVLEITSVSPPTYNGESGTSFDLVGVGFTPSSVVKFVTNDNTEYTAGSLTYNSSTSLTATTPQDFTVAQEPLSVKVVNSGGVSVTLSNAIDCGGVPSWTTAAGSLGSFNDSGTAISVNLVATDPDAGSTIAYSLSSGSLPGGVTLASNGLISGTTQTLTSTTTYNFTVTATDNANNQTNRAFSISVVATNYFGDGSDGAGVFT